MNDFSTDRWERLTELWRNKDTDSDKDAHPLNTEDKRQFELLFKIRQAMQGVQCRGNRITGINLKTRICHKHPI